MDIDVGLRLVQAALKGDPHILSQLLNEGADVNTVAYGTTALIVATQQKHLKIMSLLLDRGADVNMVVNNTTALMKATENCHTGITALLLDRGADVNMVVHGTTALVVAAEGRCRDISLVGTTPSSSYGDIVMLLLDKGADVNMVVHDTTALVVAAGNGYEDVVSLLLGKGTDVNMVVHDTTALLAAAKGRHKGAMSLLLGKGADVNKVVHGTTVLVVAAGKGYEDVVSLLLGKGADVNMVVHDTTALLAAAKGRHKGTMSLLLGKGADVNKVVHGTTALVVAVEGAKTEMFYELAHSLSILRLLLDRGADANTVVHMDTTALLAAANGGNKDIMSLLLDQGADVSMVTHDTTALIVAAEKGYDDIVSLLLGKGADVNIVVHDTTALVAAVEGATTNEYHGSKGLKSLNILRLLLDRGADANMVVHGTTALVAAVEQRHTSHDVVLLLLGQGADVNMVVHDTTALVAAVKGGHTGIVSLLLGKGADVNMVFGNTTALFVAAGRGYEDIVSLLLGKGVDVNMAVPDTTALVAAVEGGNTNISYRRRERSRLNIVKLLLDRGANVNMVTHDTTALVVAVEKKQKDIVSLLLDKGADVNMVTHNTTALVVAVEKEQKHIVSLLLGKGADVNMVVHDTTALVEAVERGQQDIVSLLLDHGADINMVAHNTTALVAATENSKGHIHIVELLLSRDADPNMVVHDTTALVAAAEKAYKDIVLILVEKGADVNMVVNNTMALVAAVEGRNTNKNYRWRERSRFNIVKVLLDRGANVNMVTHDTTALVAAVEKGHKDIVSVLLDKGADVNMVTHDTTALVAAVEAGNKDVMSLLLGRGADVNVVVHTTALIAAIATDAEKGHAIVEIVQLLLDAGADLNVAAGTYGTALIAAICVCHDHDHSPTSGNMQPPALLSMILDRNPDVSTRAGVYGTAVIAAISKLQFPDLEQTNHNQSDTVHSSGWQWNFLNRILSSVYLTPDHINVAVGEHGAPLAMAISKGNLQLLRLLVERGGDVGRMGDSCGIALSAALAAGWAQDSQRLYNILQYLVGEGADINVVSSQQFGGALGQAAYKGDRGLVSFLLECGAGPFHVGGTHYRAALGGAYPNALDAARSLGSKAQPGLVAMLSDKLKSNEEYRERAPPFPMPYTRSTLKTITVAKMEVRPSTCSDPEGICDLPAYAALTAQHADISCAALKEELIAKVLIQLVIGTGADTDAPELKCYEDWIRNDVRYFVGQGYDFGEAYAAARVGWRHFNKPEFVNLVEQHRGQWLAIAEEIDTERANSIYMYQGKLKTNTAQEIIRLPYEVMPRRLWDLTSNRVVEFRMLQSELLAYKFTTEQRFGMRKAQAKFQASHAREVPVFWAISHSWESSMDPVETPINQYQWPVPLPHQFDLECDVRQELLNYGIEYVWLDVMCLRQQATTNLNSLDSQTLGLSALNEAKKREEWKLDVPTIGNIYRVAQGIVRYFNGLGRPFSSEGWDGERHWLQRAWTLQEIQTENSTINGGIHRGSAAEDSTEDSTGDSTGTSNIMNTYGKMAGQTMTLRCAIQPVLKLAADVDTPNGCSLYALAREMSRRKATHSTDKVAGLVYLLRLTQLPTYDGEAKDNDVWARYLNIFSLDRRVELLFDFPYRSEEQHWFPTWSELMAWPEVNPHCDYSPARQPDEGLEDLAMVDLTDFEEVAIEGSLFISNIWALSHCHLTRRSVDYNVREKATGKVYGFYGPYVSQKPIEITSSEGQQ